MIKGNLAGFMTLFELLLKQPLNKKVVKEVGIEAAYIYTLLVERFMKNPDVWIKYSVAELQKDIGFGATKQNNILKILSDNNYIRIENKGMPQQRHISIVKTNRIYDIMGMTVSEYQGPKITSEENNKIKELYKTMYNTTDNKEIQEALKLFLQYRIPRGLDNTQWAMMLNDLKNYSKGNTELALLEINNAIKGNYPVLVPAWKLNENNKKNHFDNTIGHIPINIKDLGLEDEYKKMLAINENGSPMVF